MTISIVLKGARNWLMLLVLILPIMGIAQTDADLASKYWKYRQRLVGSQQDFNQEPGFVRVGTARGNSLVAMQRNRLATNHNLWSIDPNLTFAPCQLPGVHQANPVQQGWINYSDGTIVHGFYLAVLATEWKLLHDAGENTATTEDELYHAILALERLDQNAEGFYGEPASLDGFFVRDDVEADMENDFGNEFALITSTGICGPLNSDPGVTDWEGSNTNGCSGVSCNGYKETTLLSSMSQDQVIFLLLGLRMIDEFLPNNYLISSMNVRNRVRQITDRIISYVRADDSSDPGNNWIIYDPDGYTVGRGCCAKFYAYPMSLIANDITGLSYPDASQIKWDAAKVSIGVQTEVNINMMLPLGALSGDMSRSKLWNQSDNWEKEIWKLVYNVLHETNMQLDITKSFWETLLTSAPCEGPCDYPLSELANNPNIPCAPAAGWYHQNRWMSKDGKDTPKSDITGWGEYNGLDYMLAYNLYRIAFANNISDPFSNYSRNAQLNGVNLPLPFFGNNCFGCDAYPMVKQIAGTYSITDVEITILNPNNGPDYGNVTVTASEQVHLGTGFKVDRGAYFHASITPYTPNCDLIDDFQWLTSEDAPPSTLPETKVMDAPSAPQLELYPVPTTGQLTVELHDWTPEANVDVAVWDMLGRVVLNKQFNATGHDRFLLDLSQEAEGIYFVSISNRETSMVKQIAVTRK